MTELAFFIVVTAGMTLFVMNGIKYSGTSRLYHDSLVSKNIPTGLEYFNLQKSANNFSAQQLQLLIKGFVLNMHLFFAKYPDDIELDTIAHRNRLQFINGIYIAFGTLLLCILVTIIFGPTSP